MNEIFDAFEVSPVPAPGIDAVAPPLYRGIYGMPMFATIPTPDLALSLDFWTRGLGFFELFSIPGQLVHLRRWAFQDVLLTVGEPAAATTASVSFACVLDQIDPLQTSLHALGATTDVRDTPWNTRDIEVLTPEGARIVFTAAKVFDPQSAEGKNLQAVGIGLGEDEQHG